MRVYGNLRFPLLFFKIRLIQSDYERLPFMIPKEDETMDVKLKSYKNPKRLMRALIFGLIGVLVLSVSALAAYGSTSGYGKYKAAVKTLVTSAQNMTCKVETALVYDGKTVSNDTVETLIDGKNGSVHEVNVINGETQYDTYNTTIDGTTTSFNQSDTYYDEYKNGDFYNSFGFGENADKFVNFGELLADTVLGDLKNNVVLVSSDNGLSSYTMDLSAEQIPPVINAGLAFITATDNMGVGWVEYEDSDTSYANYYKETTGKDLPDGYFDALYNSNDDDAWDQYNEIWTKMDDQYQKILTDKYDSDVILYVKTDGSYKTYTSYDAYAEECLADSGYISNYLTDSAVLNDVVVNFTVNDKNQLISNDFILTFQTADTKGKSHEIVYKISAKFSDYGTTKVSPLDVGGRTLYTYDEAKTY